MAEDISRCGTAYKRYQGETISVSVEDAQYEIPKILAYPKADKKLAKKRAEELVKLGIKKIILAGRESIGECRVLGKGKSSIVVLATDERSVYAAKILRADSARDSVAHEALILRRANSFGVGPTLINYGSSVLLMEFLGGKRLDDVLPSASAEETLSILEAGLDKARRLDIARIDHGEIHDPHEHLLVLSPKRVDIIDFESASIRRRPANVTKLIQAFIIRGRYSAIVREKLSISDDALGMIIGTLRNYKKTLATKYYWQLKELLAVLGKR